MSTNYTQLTYDERIEIYACLKAGKSIPEIARLLGRSPSTVRREIKRNTGQRGYRPKQAQQKADERHEKPRYKKITENTINYINEKLNKEHSPEQIADAMHDDLGVSISHERIYQYIWDDKRGGGELYKNLRIASGKKRRKRYGKKDYRGCIPGRVGIEKRPSIVDSRSRIGDWEGDLVAGAKHKGFLVTLVERKSRLTLIGHVERKCAKLVKDEILRLMKPIKSLVHTITFDNGREFSRHQEFSLELSCETYFARPYHSWERGTNENTNGLIRQYFPKSRELLTVKAGEIQHVMDRLNHRPRKTLGGQTPLNVFLKEGAGALNTGTGTSLTIPSLC